MKKVYVITEGQTDIEILERLLPHQITKDIEFVAGGGVYGAQSLAVSILAKRRISVALVIDADTSDDQVIREKLDFSRWSLKQAAVNIPFEVFLAIPSIEAVFFQDKSLLEKITDRKFTDLEWKLMKLQPKELFANMPGSRPKLLQRILRHLDQESIKMLQEHPLIRSLINFLSSVIEKDKQQAA